MVAVAVKQLVKSKLAIPSIEVLLAEPNDDETNNMHRKLNTFLLSSFSATLLGQALPDFSSETGMSKNLATEPHHSCESAEEAGMNRKAVDTTPASSVSPLRRCSTYALIEVLYTYSYLKTECLRMATARLKWVCLLFLLLGDLGPNSTSPAAQRHSQTEDQFDKATLQRKVIYW